MSTLNLPFLMFICVGSYKTPINTVSKPLPETIKQIAWYERFIVSLCIAYLCYKRDLLWMLLKSA